jgi:hypothetical protein
VSDTPIESLCHSGNAIVLHKKIGNLADTKSIKIDFSFSTVPEEETLMHPLGYRGQICFISLRIVLY